jgi:hypothetical protein
MKEIALLIFSFLTIHLELNRYFNKEQFEKLSDFFAVRVFKCAVISCQCAGVPAVLKFKLCPEFVLKFEVVLKFRRFWIFFLKFGVAQ